MHPIPKFLGLVVISIVLFLIPDSIILHILFFCLGYVLLMGSGYSLLRIQGGRMVVITAIFIALIQLIFVKEGVLLFSAGPIRFTDQALLLAITISLRFITIILFSYLFVLTTEPTNFVLALVQLGLPYRFGFSIITAIRMVPIVKSEFSRIAFAQATRGVSYKFLPVKKFFLNISQFLKVMIISMIKRVNSLVISMEGRSFGLHKSRTFVKEVTYSGVDRLVIFGEILLIPIIIIWRMKP